MNDDNYINKCVGTTIIIQYNTCYLHTYTHTRTHKHISMYSCTEMSEKEVERKRSGSTIRLLSLTVCMLSLLSSLFFRRPHSALSLAVGHCSYCPSQFSSPATSKLTTFATEVDSGLTALLFPLAGVCLLAHKRIFVKFRPALCLCSLKREQSQGLRTLRS